MNQRKINQALDKLERASHLTREGRDWLIAACDPFHDVDIALAGYPDVLTAATIVQLVKQQVQIQVPTTGAGTVTAGSNWDCSIVLFPNCVGQPLNYGFVVDSRGNFGGGSTAVGPNTFGGLVSSAGPTGSNLWYQGATGSATATAQANTPISFVKGQGRVIGMGFEVVNTTAEINKQGQVTAWRIPTKWSETQVTNTTATTPVVTSQTEFLLNRMPPANITQAQLLFGSRSWAASEGAYVVSRQNSEDNPALLPSFANPAYSTMDAAANTTDFFIAANAPSAAGLSISDWFLPFDISGVHFTGLSYTTTLTVNIRWLIERIPGPYENDLVVLATPSAPYDPIALELYCQCIRDMPPGVMLKENPLGEWFSNALSKVSDWAPKIGNALGTIIPGASQIGNMVGMASGGLAKVIPKKKKSEKDQLRISQAGSAALPDSRSHPVKTAHYQ
jgi:hypothetical protein